LVRETEKAIKDLDVDVELIDLRTIQPYDKETIAKSVQKTGRLLVVHEAVKSFGPGAEIISMINEKAFLYLEAPPTRLTGFDITVPLPKGEHHFIITPEQIKAKIKDIMAF
jgi:pyruvate dehydrogenase E1 component beta subunit